MKKNYLFNRRIIFAPTFLLFAMALNAQVVVNSGTDFHISSGSQLYVPTNLSVSGNFLGTGLLSLDGDASFSLLGDTDISCDLELLSGLVLELDANTSSLTLNGGILIRQGAEFVNKGSTLTSGVGRMVLDEIDIEEANKWHYISPSVRIAKSDISGVSGFTNLYRYDEPSAYWVWHNSNSVSGPVEGGSVTQPAFGSNIFPGTGYAVQFSTSNPILTFSNSGSGESYLQDGTISISVSKSDLSTELASPLDESFSGINLIGNPYPSGLRIDSLLDVNSAIDALYVWDETIGLGDYVSYNNMNSADVVLAKGQGFLVKMSAAGNVSFTNSMRDSGGEWRRNQSPDNKLQLKLSNSAVLTTSDLYLDDTSTIGADKRKDALRLTSVHGEDQYVLSTMIGANEYAIQTVPNSDDLLIPLSVKVLKDGYYNIFSETYNTDVANWEFVDLSTKSSGSLEEGISSYLEQGVSYQHRFVLRKRGAQEGSISHTWKVWQDNTELVVSGPEADSFRLLDISGKLLLSGDLNNNYIAIGDLAKGFYLLELKSELEYFSQKIIIQ